MNVSMADRERLDVDHIRQIVPLSSMLRRRFDGRYPIDAFGFDPQIVDLVTPLFTSAIRVDVEGGEHIPHDGPAVLVANRGFGILEPAVLGISVRRAASRRLQLSRREQYFAILSTVMCIPGILRLRDFALHISPMVAAGRGNTPRFDLH